MDLHLFIRSSSILILIEAIEVLINVIEEENINFNNLDVVFGIGSIVVYKLVD